MKYHNITKSDMLNGEGLRVVLWVAGCDHKCRGCHNNFTWEHERGIDFDESAKQEIFAELEKSYISGLTLSGGDPLYHKNIDMITDLCREVKEKYPNKTIWLYTGHSFEELENYEVLNFVDVLCDGKFDVETRSPQKMWVGSENQRVIDVKQSMEKSEVMLAF